MDPLWRASSRTRRFTKDTHVRRSTCTACVDDAEQRTSALAQIRLPPHSRAVVDTDRNQRQNQPSPWRARY